MEIIKDKNKYNNYNKLIIPIKKINLLKLIRILYLKINKKKRKRKRKNQLKILKN